jgi:two-component system, chemotaxis family, response regulator Rcp1
MSEGRIHILVVEDTEADAFLIREALSQAGLECEAHVLDDGEKAIEFIDYLDENQSAPCPDAILLDLNLPKRTGDQVLQRIRRSDKCSPIPVVIVSSSDSPKDKLEATRLGATRYFRKPSKLAEFMQLGQLVRDLLSERHSQSGGRSA